jgi:hypothetical protein
MELAVIQKNSLAVFEPLKAACKELALQLIQVKVTDVVTESIATEIISKAKNVQNAIEEKRVNEKAPYFAASKFIDATAKETVSELLTAIDKASKELLAYKNEQDAIKKREIDRINAIKDKMQELRDKIIFAIDSAKTPEEFKVVYMTHMKTFPGAEVFKEFNEDAQQLFEQLKLYGKNKRDALLEPSKIDQTLETEKELVKKIEFTTENVGSADIVMVNSNKASNVRTNWKFEVVDINKVPKNWMVVDKSIVDAWSKQARDGGMIVEETIHNGIRFYPEKILVVKS